MLCGGRERKEWKLPGRAAPISVVENEAEVRGLCFDGRGQESLGHLREKARFIGCLPQKVCIGVGLNKKNNNNDNNILESLPYAVPRAKCITCNIL